MKRILTAVAALSLLAGVGAATAQSRYDDHRDNGYHNGQQDRDYQDRDHQDRDDRGHHDGDRHDRDGYRHDQGRHNGWRRGGRVDRNEWYQGQRMDYRRYHLRQPPRGYEWREVNGDYVLAAIASGLIYDMMLNNR